MMNPTMEKSSMQSATTNHRHGNDNFTLNSAAYVVAINDLRLK